ncbi:hypothetical protein GCM10023322_23320 [Rugosimonospora acidiphila]|uniref:Uncharacterized protein n=2 Tax=Rugosimonospora acidiphila TaxID=556531 RepID=A0ABP9RQV4_9ACTN
MAHTVANLWAGRWRHKVWESRGCWMTRGDYRREQRQMRRRIRELLAQRRTSSAGDEAADVDRRVPDEPGSVNAA